MTIHPYCLRFILSLGVVSSGLSFAASPDLGITTAPTVSPSPLTAGGSIHVTWTLRNVGAAPAGASHTLVRVYYPGAGLLTSITLPAAAVPAGGQLVQAADIPIPLEAESGKYRLFALADTAFEVPADDHADNDQSPDAFFEVVAAKIYSDLFVSDTAVISPDPVAAGGSITVKYTIANLGDAATSNPSHVRLQVFSPLSTQITEATFPLPVIGPGAEIRQSNVIALPQHFPSGRYTVQIRLDSLNEVINESETSNNYPDPVPFQFFATLPDLQLKFVEACPHALHPGDTVRVNLTLRNASSVPAPPARNRFVILDANFSPTYSSYLTNQVIAPGAEESFNVPFQIPAGVKLGKWRVTIVLNDFNDYEEANTFDNVFDPAIAFQVVGAATAVDPCVEPLRISNSRIENGRFLFDVRGPAGATIQLRTSPDLKTWTPANPVQLVNGQATVNVEAAGPQRYYAVSP